MKEFYVPIYVEQEGYIPVEANSKEEALKIAAKTAKGCADFQLIGFIDPSNDAVSSVRISSEINEVLDEEFKNFAANLTVADIDFSNKVENLIDGGELNNINWDDNDKMERKVFHYIKEHINEYQDDIIEETVRIKEKYGCTEKYELDAGLYNMDNFYLKAITEHIKND